MTPQTFIASKGGNWRKTLNKRADELGLVFGADVRQVDRHGRQPPTAPNPDDLNSTTDTANDASDQSSDGAESDNDASDD